MAETTEGVVINNEINIITKKAEENLKRLNKEYDKLVDKTKKGNLGLKIQGIEKLTKDLRALNNLSAGKNLVGQFASIAEQMSIINQQGKQLTKTLKTLQMSSAGLSALTNKSIYSGKRDRILYGDSALNSMRLTKLAQRQDREKLDYQDPEGAKARRHAESIAKWEEKQAILNETLGITQLKLMANYAAINALTSGFKYVLNYTVQYDKELRQLQAISAVSDTGLQNLKTTIEGVANATKFTSLEVAQASTVLAQAGLSVSQIKNTLPAIANLATATGTDLATSTDVITSTLNIYELQVTEATRVTNSLTTAMNESKADISGFQTAIQYAGNFAAQLGMTYEETAAAIAAATQAGIRSKSMLGTGLRAVLTEFLKPTEKLVTQLESVGLTVDDINVKTKGFNNVLKTLAQAGFGAEEAFKGMERRGAAFLAALIRQTDYMDDLRMSMAGSTAAAQANETQMKSLSNQWANFQSIAATMASNGLEPVTKTLSSLLALTNSFLKNKAVNVIGQVLFGAVTVGGTALAADTIATSMANMLKHLKGISSTAEKASKAKGVFSSLAGLINVLGVGKVGLVAAGIAALATVIYKVGDAAGLWTSEIDKLKASLEESNGAVEKASTELDTVAYFTNRLYSEQERLNSESERNIFAREMITRLPQARHYIDLTNVSIEDLTTAMVELNKIKLDNFVKETKRAAEEARKLAEATGKDSIIRALGGENFFGGGNSIITSKEMKAYNRQLLQLGGATSYKVVAGLPSLRDYGKYGYQGEFRFNSDVSRYKYYEDTNKAIKQGLNNIMNDLSLTEKEKAQMIAAWSTSLKTMAEEAGTESFFKPLLDSWAEALEKSADELNANLKQQINTYFLGSNKEIIQTYQDEINKANDALRIYNENMSETNHSALIPVSDSLHRLRDELSALSGLKTFEDYVRYIGDEQKARKQFADIRAIPGLANATDKQVLDAIINDRKEDLKGIMETISSVGDQISKAITEGNARGYKGRDIRSAEIEAQRFMLESARKGNAGKTYEFASQYLKARLARSGITSLDANGLDWNKFGSLDEAGRERFVGDLITKGSLTGKLATEVRNTFHVIGSAFGTLGEKSQKNAVKISKFEQDTREFFRVLAAGINNAERAYNSAIFALERPLAAQQGRITAANDFYGSSSELSKYQSNRLNDLEKIRRRSELPALQAYQNQLLALKGTLTANPLYTKAQNNYNKALASYNRLKGTNDVAAIENAWGVLDIASKNLEKFSDREKDLSNKIENNSLKIEELTSEIRQENEFRSKSNWGKFSSGASAAWSNWKEDREGTLGEGWLGNFGGDLTATGLNELESGFADLFTTIIDGSKDSGDAFKDMARTVLKAMRDVAIQKAATAAVNAMFSFGGMASGGLVMGPEKNRDSVPTMLMPGEFVMKKSAVDALGADYLTRLNNNAGSVIATSTEGLEAAKGNTTYGGSTGNGGVVNVYVVGQQQQQQMTPNDVVVTITNDMLKGGQTKKLVKQIAMGGI